MNPTSAGTLPNPPSAPTIDISVSQPGGIRRFFKKAGNVVSSAAGVELKTEGDTKPQNAQGTASPLASEVAAEPETNFPVRPIEPLVQTPASEPETVSMPPAQEPAPEVPLKFPSVAPAESPKAPKDPRLTLIFNSDPLKYITPDKHFNKELAEEDAKDPEIVNKIIQMNSKLVSELEAAGVDTGELAKAA